MSAREYPASDVRNDHGESCPRCEARARDYWKPEPEDPFWMLEAEDGEWLKNELSLLGTRDPSKAIRFPTERDAYNHPARMTAGSKWWSAKPTEHAWIVTDASAIEARSDATTKIGAAEGESAGPQDDAQPSPDTP